MLATPMTPQSHASPSNMACSLASPATADPRPAMAARPKLTLQTSSLPRTFGSSSTGLSLSLTTGPTASPTVRNTFKNAYEVAPPSATASPSSKLRFSKPSSPFTTHNSYQLPLGVRSILRNSPLDASCRRRSGSVATTGPNGGPSARRVFFPAKKQVSYRCPLEEEIQTVRYTARHSDLDDEPIVPLPAATTTTSSDEDSDSNTSAGPSDSGSSTSEDEPETGVSTAISGKAKKRKHQTAERQVRAVALMDGLPAVSTTTTTTSSSSSVTTTPQTPRRKRAKRRCEWRWTLGPLDQRETLPRDETPPQITSSAETITIPESETETLASDPPLSSTASTASTTYHHSSPGSSGSPSSGPDSHASLTIMTMTMTDDLPHDPEPECMNVDHPR